MKVALVYDYLNQYGGGERVLETLMEMFPEAPVYTLLHDHKRTGRRFAGRVAGTSFLDFPFARSHHRLFIPLMPRAAESLDLGGRYDLTISVTAGYAKGVTYDRNKTKHLSYILTPLRYAWEQEKYLQGVISNWQLVIGKPVFNYLKKWDYRMAQRPDALLADSRFIAGKVKNYYGREASVVYPPVDSSKFYLDPEPQTLDPKLYYLTAGRLMHYKRFDLIIDAFALLGKERGANRKLLIVGSGPEKNKLEIRNEKLGKPAEFISNASDEELRKLYNGAKAFIFPQVEDFGLVAAEAQACGAPVIAYAAGGALEILEHGKTGILFKEQTPEALAAAVRELEAGEWDPSTSSGRKRRARIAASAKRFSRENFQKHILDAVNLLV